VTILPVALWPWG